MDEIQCLPNQKVISQFIFLSLGADVFSMHDNGVSKSQDMVMQLYSCLPKKLADLV